MKKMKLSRRELLAATLSASVLSSEFSSEEKVGAQQAPVPPIDPREAALRAFLNVRPVFTPYIFSGETFPACRLEPAQAADDYAGKYQLKTRFYDAHGKAVTIARKPGVYAAVVEITPTQGRPTRRRLTLYRLAEPIPHDWRYIPEFQRSLKSMRLSNLSILARKTGIDMAALEQQIYLILSACKDRDWQALSHDPQVARLLAGLSVGIPASLRETFLTGADQDGLNTALASSTPSSTPSVSVFPFQPRKNLDAFAAERQWWVQIKRRLSGLDKSYSQLNARMGPERTNGKPAVMLRQGSLAEAGMKADTIEKIDATLRAWAADTDQAFAVCIARHGVIALHSAYGTRDGWPMTTETKSWMASITKPMCATLMMMLVDRGLVGLDDPIDKYLPQLRGLAVETPITIRHLYTHTSGLDKWPGWSDELPDMEDQLADCYPFVRVGKVWSYGGQGNSIGAKIIEAVSGEALPIAYLRHLHGPLGNRDTDVIGAHADAFSTPLDIARFGQMLLNRGAYGRLRFMRPETFALMLPQKLTQTLGPETTKTFGIGLDGQPNSFGHGAASAATFHIETDRELVVVMTRNSIGTNYDKYNGKFWQAINDSTT